MLDLSQDQSRWNLELASKKEPRGLLFLVGFIAGTIARSMALRSSVTANLGSTGWHLRASQCVLPRGLGGLRIAGGSGRPLLRLRGGGEVFDEAARDIWSETGMSLSIGKTLLWPLACECKVAA